MKKIVRAVSLMLLLTGFSGNAVADERGTIPRDGAIHGRVIDNEKQTLPGASIYIEDLKTGVISDINGFYMLPNLKPGTYTIKVTYVGYAPMKMKMTMMTKSTRTYVLFAADRRALPENSLNFRIIFASAMTVCIRQWMQSASLIIRECSIRI